jgi:mono/diheme cytochrome c family protein
MATTLIVRVMVLCMLLAGSAGASVWADEPAPAVPTRFDPAIELPDDNGKELILAACTRCHELRGLAAYRGYWAKPQWTAMVESMVKSGAVLTPQQIDEAAEYLARHFGKNSP